jgi:NAD(P)-dependent dehydrogenase (short-subunit alcohol dehydrogenase family)
LSLPMWIYAVLAALLLFLLRNTTAVQYTYHGLLGVLQSCFTRVGPLPLTEEQMKLFERKTVLITGANRGLGKGIATDLASCGFRIIMACRSGISEAVHEVVDDANQFLQQTQALRKIVVKESQLQTERVDIGSIKSVDKCVASLKAKGVKLDMIVANAAVVPFKTELNSQGLENAFAINFLGHFYLIKRLIEEGVFVLPKDDEVVTSQSIPRVVLVSSEAHRSSDPLTSIPFGEPRQYSLSSALNHYSYTKLLVAAFAHELARRLNISPVGARVRVVSLCPGPVDTNIAHHAPPMLRRLANGMLKLCFASPLRAARYITLRLTEEVSVQDRNCRYYHQYVEKPASADATDPKSGSWLWDQSDALLQ